MKLRKLLLYSLFISASMMSQVPHEMSYQIMVLDPDNGKVMANEDAEIRIEIRKDSPSGEIAWSNTYSVKTNERGICNLMLEVGNDVNWENGEYYFASIINGKECGVPKITSVPYAFCSETAKTATIATKAYSATILDGIPTRSQLIGTWVYIKDNNTYKYIFNEDGTGEYVTKYYTYTFNYHYSPAGSITFDVKYSSLSDWHWGQIQTISDTQLSIWVVDNGMSSGVFTKQ